MPRGKRSERSDRRQTRLFAQAPIVQGSFPADDASTISGSFHTTSSHPAPGSPRRISEPAGSVSSSHHQHSDPSTISAATHSAPIETLATAKTPNVTNTSGLLHSPVQSLRGDSSLQMAPRTIVMLPAEAELYDSLWRAIDDYTEACMVYDEDPSSAHKLTKFRRKKAVNAAKRAYTNTGFDFRVHLARIASDHNTVDGHGAIPESVLCSNMDDSSMSSTITGRSGAPQDAAATSKGRASSHRHATSSNAVPSVLLTTHRSFVTASVRTMHWAGNMYQTNPATFLAGDAAHWRYANDILKLVEIQSFTPPSPSCPTWSYSIKAIQSSSTDLFTTRHEDLYIPVIDDRVIVDEKGIDAAAERLFSLQEYTNKRLNPDLNAEDIRRFSRMSQDKFSAKTFLAGTSSLSIQEDSLAAFQTFWSALNILLAASNKYNISYLPPWNDLHPTLPLRTQVYPPATFSSSDDVKTHLDFVGTLVYSVLQAPSLTLKAPRARTHLRLIITGTSDGWDALEQLAKKVVPRLGRLDFNVDALIQSLRATHGLPVDTFLTKAKQIDGDLRLAGVVTSPNQLLRHFMSELMKCANLTPLVAQIHHRMTVFWSTYGYSALYTEDSVLSISDYLLAGNNNGVITLTDQAKRSTYKSPSSSSSANKPRFSSFNRPQYAAASTQDTDIMPALGSDLSPPSVTSTSPDTPPSHHDLDTEFIRDMVKPVLAALDFDDPDENLQSLTFNAMVKSLTSQGPCEVCGGRHDADKCRARGLAFLPPWLRKAVLQYNAVHGDTPKVPPADTPPPPRNPRIPTRPEKRNMTVHWKDSSDDDSDANDDSPTGLEFHMMGVPEQAPSSSENVPSASTSPRFQLCSAETTTDIQSTLDRVAQDISANLDSAIRDCDPKFALMDISRLDKTAPPSSSTETHPADLSTPMSVDDYDTYGFSDQVKA